MKKDAMRGIVSLLLCSMVLTFLLLVLRRAQGGDAFDIGGTVHSVGLALCFLAVSVIFFASKGRRLRIAVMIVLGAAGGLLLGYLDLPVRQEFLLIAGVFLLYLLGCVLVNRRRFGTAFRRLNAAWGAYQQDQNGEKYLEALDQCSRAVPESTPIRTEQGWTIRLREYLDCSRMQVLGDMGRLEERRTLLERLRRETKSPEFRAWLDRLATDASLDICRENGIK